MSQCITVVYKMTSVIRTYNGGPYYRGVLNSEVIQYTTVLHWDIEWCPYYRGFHISEVCNREVPLYKILGQYPFTKVSRLMFNAKSHLVYSGVVGYLLPLNWDLVELLSWWSALMKLLSMKCSKQLIISQTAVSMSVVWLCTFSISCSSLLITTSITITDNIDIGRHLIFTWGNL